MSLEAAAIDYLSEGYCPIALWNDKSPAETAGSDFLNKINDDLTRFDRAEKIGIACGQVSGGFYGLDFDCHDGEPIAGVFELFIKDDRVRLLIQEKKLSVFHTMSGGYHVYFRCDATWRGKPLAKWKSGKVMIEIRGNGQYLAVHPSRGYVFITGAELTELQYIDEYEAKQLVILCRTLSETDKPVVGDEHAGELDTKKLRFTYADFGEPNSYKEKFNRDPKCIESALRLLNKAGWKHDRQANDNTHYYIRPGKEKGIGGTFRIKQSLFYCWTENAAPLKADCAYNAFDIMTVFKFKGDYEKAEIFARSLFVTKTEDDPKSEFLPFPVDVFPSEIQYLIDEFNSKMNYSPDFTAAAILFSIATVCGNKYKLKVKNEWHAPPMIWILGVGASGSNKSHPFNTIIKAITAIDRRSFDVYSDKLKEYEQAEKKEKLAIPRFYQHIVKDATIEAIHQVHDINKRGIGLHKDEFIGFIKGFNKYKKAGGDEGEFWLEGFNNSNYVINRAGSATKFIDNIHINITGTIQPEIFKDIPQNLKDNGLIYRFLFTRPELNIHPLSDQDVDKSCMSYWFELIEIIHRNSEYTSADDTLLLEFTTEARELFKQVDIDYTAIQNNEETPRYLRQYISKIKTYMPRFALLMFILEFFTNSWHLREVNDQHVKKAKRLSDYFINTATIFFAEMEKDEEIEEITRVAGRGKTKQEKILVLHSRGVKNIDIAKKFGVSAPYVSKVLKEWKDKKVNQN